MSGLIGLHGFKLLECDCDDGCSGHVEFEVTHHDDYGKPVNDGWTVTFSVGELVDLLRGVSECLK